MVIAALRTLSASKKKSISRQIKSVRATIITMVAPRLTKTQAFTLVSVLCSIFLAALDQTIVATAAPKIASDLQDFEAISWIFSAYMLASTVMIPVYGKLSDNYGRRIFYFGGILVFLFGSVLCGTALTMTWIIVARAIQGLGAGAIMVESFTIIGDIFPPAERGKWQGIISSVFGLASIIGPLLGGFFTDYASWRLVFFINIPIGIVAMYLVHLHFPASLKKGSQKRINFPNAMLLAFTLLTFLFALVRSEAHGKWLSADIIGLALVSLVSLVAFIVRDRRASNPIFPALLFHNRIFNLSIISLFFLSICMFGVISYIPLFAQMALLASPSSSGFILLPFVISMTTASALSGQIVSRSGKYKMLLIFGVTCVSIGTLLLSRMTIGTSAHQLTRDLIFVGTGIGFTMPIYMVIVQSSFSHDKLGIVTSSMQLIRNIGATLGTALLGTLIMIYVEKHLIKLNIHVAKENMALGNFSEILQAIQSNTQDQTSLLAMRTSFAGATHLILSLCLVLTVATLVITFFLPVIRLRKTNTVVSE